VSLWLSTDIFKFQRNLVASYPILVVPLAWDILGYLVFQDPWAPLAWDIPGYCRPGTCPGYLGIPKDVPGQVVAVPDILQVIIT